MLITTPIDIYDRFGLLGNDETDLRTLKSFLIRMQTGSLQTQIEYWCEIIDRAIREKSPHNDSRFILARVGVFILNHTSSINFIKDSRETYENTN